MTVETLWNGFIAHVSREYSKKARTQHFVFVLCLHVKHISFSLSVCVVIIFRIWFIPVLVWS